MSEMHATGCPICGYDNADMTLMAQLSHVTTDHSWLQRYRLYRQTRTPLKDLLINRKYSDGGRAFLSRLESRDAMVLDIWCAACGWRFTAGDFYVPLPGEWGYWVHSMSCGRNPGHGPDETPRRPTHERLADGAVRLIGTGGATAVADREVRP